MLQPIGDQSQSQRLHRDRRLLAGSPVCGNAWQGRDIRQPPSILLAVVFDGQREAGWSLWHESIMTPFCRIRGAPVGDQTLLRSFLDWPSASLLPAERLLDVRARITSR